MKLFVSKNSFYVQNLTRLICKSMYESKHNKECPKIAVESANLSADISDRAVIGQH